MGLSRRFLNLIVNDHIPGLKSLRCIDLTSQRFFYPGTPPPPPKGDGSGTSSAGGVRDAATSRPPASKTMKMEMERVFLPRPSFTFRPGHSDATDEWRIHCFPLEDRKVICADQLGRSFVFDAETCTAGTMPALRSPKRMPFSLFVPRAHDVEDRRNNVDDEFEFGSSLFDVEDRRNNVDEFEFGSSLFVMDRLPEPESGSSHGGEGEGEHSVQFEAFISNRLVPTSGAHKGDRHWRCHPLPPPPFVRDDRNSIRPEITAYGVVGGGSHICVSAEGAGTYCMDTASHTWTQVGKWMLPFYGKVEHVPELNLWFGLCAESRRLAAADLSGMDPQSQDQDHEPPQLVGPWEELDPPKKWKECRDPQIVNLGSGRFCIARFFQARGPPHGSCSSLEDGKTGEDFAVLTGMEVVSCVHDDRQAGDGSGGGNGKKVMKLRMIKHKSRRLHGGGGTIDTMF